MLRYFTVYGPRQRPDMAFTAMLEALARGDSFRLFGDGSAARSFTYVARRGRGDDRGDGARAAGEVYNVGGGDEATMNEAIALRRADLRPPPRRRADEAAATGDVRRTKADVSEGGSRAGLGAADRRSKTGMRAQWRWAAVESPA